MHPQSGAAVTLAEEAAKSVSSKGKASKATKKATTDDEGRKLTKCLDRALHDCVGDIGDMEDATLADCTALRPLALKLAKVYKPCVLQAKKTELMVGRDIGGRVPHEGIGVSV